MDEFSPLPPPFFSEHLLSFFSYPSNIDLKHLNQALVLLYYYKNSPPHFKILDPRPDFHKKWVTSGKFLNPRRMPLSFATCTYSSQIINAQYNNLHV